MRPIGPKIAEGRDSEIFEHGPDLVLRVPRDGRSLVEEAQIMRHVQTFGYPVPTVHDAGEGFLVMDRIDGPMMMDLLGKPPFPVISYGRILAELHQRLHQIPAPQWLGQAPLPGDRVVHRDLHPMNVLISPQGPIVIDWSNALAGDPAFDVADTWVLLACVGPVMRGVDRLVVPLGRRLFLRAFLSRVDREAARRAIPAAVANRLTDTFHSPAEHDMMRRLASWAATAA